MARFTGGWIKLWRKSVEGDLADNMFLWGLWNWLLFAAVWKPTSIIWKGERRDIPPGTVVMGMKELAEKWDCSQSTIKKWLTYLEKSERIFIETCSRGTLVTVRNWAIYQATDAGPRDPSENEVGAECEPSENQVGLNEEVKKEEVKKEESICPELETSSCGAIADFSGDDQIEKFLKRVSISAQTSWVKLYGDPDWIQREFLKMISWLIINPKKSPKGSPARFIGGWLSRGWEQHRKSISADSHSSRGISEILSEAAS